MEFLNRVRTRMQVLWLYVRVYTMMVILAILTRLLRVVGVILYTAYGVYEAHMSDW